MRIMLRRQGSGFTFVGRFAVLVGVFALAHSARGVQTIYQDDFSGSGALNGVAPDVRPGSETWSATEWQDDGSISSPTVGNGSNAFLPFTPASGQIYTLSLDMNPTAATDPTNWFAVGFTPVASPANQFFGQYNAAPWVLLRARRDGNDGIPNNTDDTGDIETFPGPFVTGVQDHDAPNGTVNFQIVLDTTGSLWQTQWLVNSTLIRTDTYAANPTINYVGFGRLFDAVGTVDNFSLTSVPEPAGLLAVALLGMIGRRRKI